MSPIDGLLELLEDGKWHDLNEIVEKSRLNEFEVEIVTKFLAEYTFIQFDNERQKARLTPPTLSFFKKIQQIEKESSQPQPLLRQKMSRCKTRKV